jgi:hypothetical protein
VYDKQVDYAIIPTIDVASWVHFVRSVSVLNILFQSYFTKKASSS